jgi:glucose/arabinose dehydrogenase
MENRPGRAAAAALVLAAACGHDTAAPAAMPGGFTGSTVVSGLASPTAMELSPDGRIFVAEQAGRLRVVKGGALLAAPFLEVPVDSSGERGLLGVALDPAFASNGHVYVYYTTTSPTVHNRLSRFTAAGDVAAPGSEVVLLELDDLSAAVNHNGGGLHFGPDGKLYVGVGENANGPNAQSLANLLGKLLRLDPDGGIPADNPFVGSATGKNRAIWALGLRNPFSFAFQPGTGRLFIDDVGASTWEEIDEGVAGANYGWPATEGPTDDPRFRGPIFVYGHGSTETTGCAIAGGTFYDPPSPTFPASYVGSYFFSDLCGGWIHRLAPSAGNAVSAFAIGLSGPVDLRVGQDGALYYLEHDGGTIGRIQYTGP